MLPRIDFEILKSQTGQDDGLDFLLIAPRRTFPGICAQDMCRSRLPLADRIWPFLLAAALIPFIRTEVHPGNVASDLAAIESLVERQTFFINDSTFFYTIDKLAKNGRFFSQKSPLFHLAGAFAVAPFEILGWRFATNLPPLLAYLTTVLVLLPLALTLIVFGGLPCVRDLPAFWRRALTIGLALATLLLPFSLTLNHYVGAGLFLLMGFRQHLLALKQSGATDRRRRWALAGFYFSLSVAFDVTAGTMALGVAAVASLLTHPRSLRLAACLALGATPIVIAYGLCDVAMTGNPLPVLMQPVSLDYPGSVFNAPPEPLTPEDYKYYEKSLMRRAFHSTVGHKGVAWMMPGVALGFVALVATAFRRSRLRGLAIAVLLAVVADFVAVIHISFDLSGGAYGMRHFIPLIPILAFWIAVIPRLRHPAARWVLALLWLPGIPVACLGMYNPWSSNTISPYPPLENLARLFAHADPAGHWDWLTGVIEKTSFNKSLSWFDLGTACAEGDHLEEAEAAYRLSTEINPRRALAHYQLGNILHERGREDQAIGVYRKVVELQPDNVGAWNNLGHSYLILGGLQNALECYNKSNLLAPDNASSIFGRAAVASFQGQATEAEKLRAVGLSLYPEDPRFASESFPQYLALISGLNRQKTLRSP